MTRKLYLVPPIIAETEIVDLPNFDIIVHDDEEEESWFREAIKHLEEENE